LALGRSLWFVSIRSPSGSLGGRKYFWALPSTGGRFWLGRLPLVRLWAPVLIYIGGIFWTLFYDTIYAHQDTEDDALIGVKSTARLFGQNTSKWLKWFMAATVSLLGAGLVLALAPTANPLQLAIALAGVWAFGWHMMWQLSRLDIDDPAKCLALFRSNRNAGLIPVLFLAVAYFA